MDWISHILTVVFVINILLAITVVFLERRNVAATWSWLMVLLFIPILGFLLYVMLGQNLSRRKLYKWNRRMLERVQTVISEQRTQLIDGTLPYIDPMVSQYRDLIYLNVATNDAFLTQDNGVHIFTDGVAKFSDLLMKIEAAESHIHMQYYIVKNDSLGQKIMEALTRKAEQGVHVKFLYDDIGSRSLNESFFRDFLKAGGQKAAFFPSRIPFLNYRVNYRNHRKLVIIDGQIGYMGGFNVGNEYLGLDPRFGYWRDTHLRLTGSVVRALQSRFILDWNLASVQQMEVEPQYFPDTMVEVNSLEHVPMQIVASGPNEAWPHFVFTFLKMIHMAKSRILLQTPYFIPEESMLNALRIAALSGIDVRIMIPEKADHMFVHWASLYYVGELLRAGVKCYLYDQGFLHAKTIIVDGRVASVGTANFDIRSLRLNFETNALMYHAETAKKLENTFWKDMEGCMELTLEEYDKRSLRIRFLESISKLVSPIL
ncbi:MULTISPECIES: cardiolipin synthase [unclassified Paenibacillus]|uniref:cardiolipin synthase n=1 Tax=unclassified Paenibacillus TaxID=185978 RepID=UPI00070DBF54|nr:MULTISPECIES: cardiolipin synthase [unclassified Paenibacillus]KQX68671.1 cardiolipin synthase [Paenibacillus sp. Root444D2]KRE32474.1 cardiolipin synthase [Paenibacillus sp. Soil724D2]